MCVKVQHAQDGACPHGVWNFGCQEEAGLGRCAALGALLQYGEITVVGFLCDRPEHPGRPCHKVPDLLRRHHDHARATILDARAPDRFPGSLHQLKGCRPWLATGAHEERI